MSENEAVNSLEAPVIGDEVVMDSALNAASIRNPKILSLPVRIIVSVGKARITVQELLDLTQESVIDLESKIHDPAEIYVGDRLIARGELVEVEEGEAKLGIRLIEICETIS